MTILLLTVMIAAEIAFLIAEFSKVTEKRKWNTKRLAVDLIELAAFAVMLLLPEIDLSFRFKGMLFLLLVRLLLAAIGYLIGRKKEGLFQEEALSNSI